MDGDRLINDVFTESAVDKIGKAYNKLIKSNTKLSTWAHSIFRSASAFEPVEGVETPYILNAVLTVSNEFFPGKKQRKIVVCGSLFVFEEPYRELLDDDITIVSAVDEWEKVILSDPHLRIDDNIVKAERVHRFELSGYSGKPEEDKVTIYLAYRVEYIVDIDYATRFKM